MKCLLIKVKKGNVKLDIHSGQTKVKGFISSSHLAKQKFWNFKIIKIVNNSKSNKQSIREFKLRAKSNNASCLSEWLWYKHKLNIGRCRTTISWLAWCGGTGGISLRGCTKKKRLITSVHKHIVAPPVFTLFSVYSCSGPWEDCTQIAQTAGNHPGQTATKTCSQLWESYYCKWSAHLCLNPQRKP